MTNGINIYRIGNLTGRAQANANRILAQSIRPQAKVSLPHPFKRSRAVLQVSPRHEQEHGETVHNR